MTQHLLYSPPNGTLPQEIPFYYRGPDGIIRTDLKELSHNDLIAFGFTGPYEFPKATYTDENGDVIEGDYNPETHYWEWSQEQRQFLIKSRETEESHSLPLAPPPPTLPSPNWTAIKQEVLSYEPLNLIIAEAISVVPIAALAFPATFLECERGNYSDFTNCWNAIKSSMNVSEDVINYIVERCEYHNLPSEFISII